MDNSPQTIPTSGDNRRKRSIWFHLHFWIGWIAAAPIALVCLTGALLIFEQDIFRWEHKALFQLDETGTPLSIEQILESYRSAEPRLRVNHLSIPEAPNHSYSAFCTEIDSEGDRGARVFLNPYTGELTWMSEGVSISHLLIDIHRHLVAGKTGQMVVAISSVVLAITGVIGLVLWWPRRGRTFIRAWQRGQAIDWHNALGLVILIPLIVMAVTGVAFTWGRQIWPMLESLQGASSLPANPVITVPVTGEKVSLDAVVESIRANHPGQRITGLQPGNRNDHPYKAFLDADGKNLQLTIDPYTGEERSFYDGSGTGPVGLMRKNFGRIHTLGPYPLFVRIIWGLMSLGGTVLVVTGIWISVKRWGLLKGRI